MEGQRYRLTVNKSKMYELVRRHFGITMRARDTEFIAYRTSRSYALDYCYDGVQYHYFLCSFADRVSITQEIRRVWDDEPSSLDVVDIDFPELMELGLIEPVPQNELYPGAAGSTIDKKTLGNK